MKLTHTTLVYFIVCLFSYLFVLPQTVFAAGEFQADYDVQYAISPAGKTIVTQHVALVNKLSNYYPKQYSLLLDSDKISNVIAYDDGGVITPTISVKDGRTDIALTFNGKTIGLGKSTTFSLRYEHAGIASRNGSIWEVYVPGITNDPDIGAYNVTLSVPPTFGASSYITPLPSKGATWTKDQMIKGGIAAAYGTEQHFALTLRYTLSNPSLGSSLQNIALPPDTSFQNVTIRSLNPKPKTVTRDDDGNWIAQYDVPPAQSQTIVAKVDITTYLAARTDFKPVAVDTNSYLSSGSYWPVADSKIQTLAKTYTTPKQIYTYVSSALTYDYSKVDASTKRLGALEALASPKQSVCTEFTDVFIAIARAAGIPARRNVGYAYTNNPKLRPLSLVSDVLHAWPEYYDRERQIWVPIDPTWANTTGGADYFTKLDFNHIVFAINGLDSTRPYPAGFYHSTNTQSKDITVEFANSTPNAVLPHVTSQIEFPAQVGSGTTPTGAVIVTNEGGQSAYTIAVDVQSDLGNINTHEIISELLPYASVRIPFSARISQSLQSRNGTITAKIDNATITSDFTVRPFAWLIGAALLTILAICAVAAKLFHMFVWKKFKKR